MAEKKNNETIEDPFQSMIFIFEKKMGVTPLLWALNCTHGDTNGMALRTPNTENKAPENFQEL